MSVRLGPFSSAPDMGAFAEKTVLITGGSSGIGRSLAAAFIKVGARVTIVSNDSERLASAWVELARGLPHVAALTCDVADLAQVRSMVARQVELGTPDILINNAGFATYRAIEQSTSEELGRLIGVNLMGAMHVTKEFLPSMIANGGGHIVNISSVAGKLIITPNAAYCAAKHGLVAWSEALKIELRRFGMRIHIVCPGRVETPFFDHPTFQTRPPSRATSFGVSLDKVTQATMAAISHNHFLTYVPKSFGLAAWLAGAVPGPSRLALGLVNRSRIDALYNRVAR